MSRSELSPRYLLSENLMKLTSAAICAVALALASVGAADAKGCIKGAVVGGAAPAAGPDEADVLDELIAAAERRAGQGDETRDAR